jgi:hypothetical protein
LRLPALRAGWAGADEDRVAALVEWNRSGSTTAGGGRETKQWAATAWKEAAGQTEAVWRSLASVAIDDRAEWAAAAADAAGVVAGLAGRLEADGPGALSRAADALAKAAQLRPQARAPRRGSGSDLRGVAAVATQAALPGGAMAWALVMAELLRMAKAIEQAHRARDAAGGAVAAAATARAALEDVHARYALAGVIAAEGPAGGRQGPAVGAERTPGEAGIGGPTVPPRPVTPTSDEQRRGFER